MDIIEEPFRGYCTENGNYWCSDINKWFDSSLSTELQGSIDLIITSPPFPLNRKKKYGNLQGQEYVAWLADLAPKLKNLLSEKGSLVIEIGNAWNPGEPTMSTLPIEALLTIKKEGSFNLCQEFICHNPARLPSPIQYVNVERERIKDSWTRIWWLSKTSRPKANNKNVLLPYSKSMKRLLKKQKYNAGLRPSEHNISETGFLKDNGGSIPASCLTQAAIDHFGNLLISSNTKSSGDPYLAWCKENDVKPHPARMQEAVVAFFISFLTDENDMVLDPFGGSNTTGWVAERLNRRWTVIEIMEDYLIPSMSRFSDEVEV